MALHLLALLVVAAPRVVVIPVEGPHDAQIEATLAEGARAAGLDVVPLRDAKQAEKLVPCARTEVDCLLRMAALGDVDGAIAWHHSRDGGAVDVIVVSLEQKRNERAKIDEVEALCRRAFAPPVTATPPLTPPVTTPPAVTTPPVTTPLTTPPPLTPPPLTPPPLTPPPPTTAPPTGPPPEQAGGLDVTAIALAIGGGVVAVACGAGAIVLDAGLRTDLERATQRIAPRPDDFELRQGLFFGALVGAGAGVVAAGAGAVLLATE